MSLKVAVGTPFRTTGRSRLEESEFVVALSLDRDWFSPDQAKRLIDVAVVEGLLKRSDGELVAQFTLESITIPDGFSPDESILQKRTTFERVLDSLASVEETKRESVAGINELQASLSINPDAAAVLYAHRHGLDIKDLAQQVRAEISTSSSG